MKRLLQASLLLFIVSAFALPTEAAFSLVFYVCVVPLAVLALPAQESCTKAISPAIWLALALILWSGLTLLWGEDNGRRSLRFLLGAAATAAFVLALSDVLQDHGARRRLASVLICAGLTNAALVLLLNAPTLLRGDRILGWGVTRQPILGGSVMAMACLTSLSRCKTPRPRLRERDGPAAKRWEGEVSRPINPLGHRSLTPSANLLYGAAAAPMAGFVLAMQSRGALLGLAGGVTVIAMSRLSLRNLAAIAATIAVLGFALHATTRQFFLGLLLERGTSHRLEIWSQALTQIRAKPLLGHGLAANLPVSPTGFPHSLYLSLLFYSGAIGFALFAALATVVTLRLCRSAGPERGWVAALWVNALIAGLTDFGQITKGPGPLWFILWLPILLALAHPVTPPATAEALPSAAN